MFVTTSENMFLTYEIQIFYWHGEVIFAASLLLHGLHYLMINIEIVTSILPKSCYNVIKFENKIQCIGAEPILAET